MPKAVAMRFVVNRAPQTDAPNLPPRQARKSLARMLAWLGIRSSCRHVPALWGRGGPVIVGLVVPADRETAAVGILESLLLDEGFDSVVLSARKTSRKSLGDQLEDTMAEDSVSRIGVVVPEENMLPSHFGILADAVVHVPPTSARHFSVAVWHVLKQHVGPDDAAYLATQDPNIVEPLLRKTRNPAKVTAALRRMSSEPRPGNRARPDAPRLEDLHGYGEAAEWGLDLARDLADWKAGTLPWSDVDRGVLLSGAPGTGKTTFAAALARTCGAHFIPGSYATWQSAGHLGDFQRAVRKAFDEAKSKAPSILLIDEVDALGSRETGDKHDRDYTDKVIATFLECLDGSEGREGVVVIGAANHPDRLDPALRRPGRLDRHIVIPLPDARARTGILRHHLSRACVGEDLSTVVELTEGMAGAGLEQLVRQARRLARRHRRDMTVGDMLECLPPRIPVPEAARWRIAVHEAGHAVVGLTEGHGRLVSVEVSRMRNPTPEGPRMRAQATWELDDGERITSQREDYLRNIAVTLGGIAAEKIVFGAASDGAGGGEESDLATATRLAAAVEGSLGLGGSLTHLATLDHVHLLATRDYTVRKRVEETLQESLRRAESIVDERRDDVLAVAREVFEREKLTGEEVREITSRQPRLALVR